ncbi:MAG: C4-type zinc ribbon domain-containing protein [Verrucomicrobiota bacterium]|jgi:predicted  nucleic acid-binding Zn-ribbon protein
MNELLQNLVKLQAIEFDGISEKSAGTTVELLRSKIPPQILGHYDRLMVKGKKGVTAVRNQVCTGCHMRVPIAVVTTLMHDTDIQLCENCGRYLFLAAEAPAEPAEAARKPKPAKRGRKPKNPRPLAPTAA